MIFNDSGITTYTTNNTMYKIYSFSLKNMTKYLQKNNLYNFIEYLCV